MSITKFHDNIQNINEMTKGKFNGIKSADFFAWLISEKDEKIISHVKNILNRSELYEISNNYESSGITIKDIFGDIEIFYDIRDKDSAKCYSVFQYIELLYIIQSFATTNNKDINLCFLLPNDETKYYSNKYLNDDILKLKNIDTNINIYFVSFLYGKKLEYRPYLSGKKYVSEITMDML